MHSAILAAALLLAFTAAANGQVKLERKTAEDTTTKSTVTSKTHQIITINEMEIETNSEETVTASTTSGKRKADGTLEISNKVDSLKIKLELPGGVELVYDSSKENEPQGTAADFLLDVFAVIPKIVSTTVVDKDNKVVSVKVDEKPLEDLSDQAKAILQGRFDEDYLKEAANKQNETIPTKPVNKGDTWEISSTTRIGQGQTLSFKTTYKYEGSIDKNGKTFDKITFASTEVEYAQDAPNSPVKVTDSKLKVNSSKGMLLFNRQLGRIVEHNDDLHVTGDLTLDAGGKELPAKLDLTIKKTMLAK